MRETISVLVYAWRMNVNRVLALWAESLTSSGSAAAQPVIGLSQRVNPAIVVIVRLALGLAGYCLSNLERFSMKHFHAAHPWAHDTRRLIACSVVCLGATLISMNAVAQKEDVVIFNNGDRLTGEIRELSRGQLSFNTDATGTIQIDWIEVAELRSSNTFEIELANGVRYLGSLRVPEEPGELNIDAGGTEPFGLSFARVVGMTEIESTFRDRLDIDLHFGYDFTKTGDVETLSLGFHAAYVSEKNVAEIRLNTIRTDRGANGGLVNQASLNFAYTRLLRDRWLATGLIGFESNSELGIDLRTTAGGAAGRVFRQSGQHRISWRAGLIRTHEEVADSSEVNNSTEGLLNLSIDWFRTTGNEFDVSSRLTIFPSISESGRYRSEFDIKLEWELFEDITWGLIFYHDFDSNPPSVDAVRADYGIITSIGVDF